MPRRSTLLQLPQDLRRALNEKLVANGFANYDVLEEWLNAECDSRGLEINVSRSSIHRHGQKFEQKLEKMRLATEQAKAIADGSGDDEGSMNEALIRLVQTKMFDALLDLEDDKQLSKFGLAISRLTRASVASKKWMTEVRTELEAQKQDAAQAVEKLSAERGLPNDVADMIRAKILGISVDAAGG